MFKQVEIESTPFKTEIKADGVTLKGVRKFKVTQELGMEIPSIEVECISHDINLDIKRADLKFSFKDGWVDVNKCLPDEEESVLALVQDKFGLHQEVLYRRHFEETDAIYAGTYWCSYRTLNIEAMNICKVLAWQGLPEMGDYENE